jgi:hypothetical protein
MLLLLICLWIGNNVEAKFREPAPPDPPKEVVSTTQRFLENENEQENKPYVYQRMRSRYHAANEWTINTRAVLQGLDEWLKFTNEGEIIVHVATNQLHKIKHMQKLLEVNKNNISVEERNDMLDTLEAIELDCLFILGRAPHPSLPMMFSLFRGNWFMIPFSPIDWTLLNVMYSNPQRYFDDKKRLDCSDPNSSDRNLPECQAKMEFVPDWKQLKNKDKRTWPDSIFKAWKNYLDQTAIDLHMIAYNLI